MFINALIVSLTFNRVGHFCKINLPNLEKHLCISNKRCIFVLSKAGSFLNITKND